MPKKNTRLVILLTIVLAALVIAGALFVLQNINTNRNVSAPHEEDGLSVRVSLPKQSYSYGDTISFKSTIQNVSSQEKTFNFNCTYTAGSLYVDDDIANYDIVCGTAITEVTLKPGETKTYDYTYKLVKEFPKPYADFEYKGKAYGKNMVLQTGEHTAHIKWQGVQSEKITFNVTE